YGSGSTDDHRAVYQLKLTCGDNKVTEMTPFSGSMLLQMAQQQKEQEQRVHQTVTTFKESAGRPIPWEFSNTGDLILGVRYRYDNAESNTTTLTHVAINSGALPGFIKGLPRTRFVVAD